ncbi:MAG: hypothetical protein AUI01_07770 [Ktedonobacter sp. 13_2_20CM_2_56_8]|nr:MAG: hypothetical protein AUI01_07770 [Ktedonobacter sp. 13_2_20CM_2_56_8]
MHSEVFPEEEYAARLKRMRAKMEEEGLDACLLSSPENIYYLAGLNHWGYFGFHLLIVPREGNLALIARNVDGATIRNQLASRVEFRGFKDSEVPIQVAATVLKEKGLSGQVRLGMDMGTLYRSYIDTKQLIESLPEVEWQNSHNFMNTLRFSKSRLELAAVRQAAVISERMMEAAIRATTPGVNEKAIAAEVFKEMILAGGEPPSFGPFIRPTSRLDEEHTTWGQNFLAPDDTLFVELAGCYQRYHAPMGRFIYLKPPTGIERVQNVCLEAFNAVTEAMKPGVTAHEVYQAWQSVVDKAGIPEYRRHHCGYMVGISFPPSWTEGGNRMYSLREGSDLVLQAGMVFHILSWLVGSRLGDYFVSNTVAVTETGCEVFTTNSQNALL